MNKMKGKVVVMDHIGSLDVIYLIIIGPLKLADLKFDYFLLV